MSSKHLLKVDWATHQAAKYACEHWHYSKCIPKLKLVKIGVWEESKFIGVVIFSYGANHRLGTPYGLQMIECVELTRIALMKHKNAVSRIISIAIKFLKKRCPNLRLIVSYADADNGHHGGIYQANGWIYEGLKGKHTNGGYIINGKKIHTKTIYDRIGSNKWEDIKKHYPDAKIFYTKGKHRYIMPLDDDMKKQVQSLAKPYPKRTSSKDIVASGDQSEEGGESPTDVLQSSKNIKSNQL